MCNLEFNDTLFHIGEDRVTYLFDDADIFVACTSFDEANIVSCLTVSRLSRAKTVCFVSKPEYIESLKLVKNTQYEMIDYVIEIQPKTNGMFQVNIWDKKSRAKSP